MPKLYHCPDARSLRCLWLLEELRLPYELEVMPFPPRQRAPEFLQINPTGTVPYFVDGKLVMNESVAVLEYLATKHGSHGLALEAAHDEHASWLNWLHFGECALTTPLAMYLRFTAFAPEEQRIPQIGADFCSQFAQRVKLVESVLADREYLSANRFTIADISVGYALFLCTRIGQASLLCEPLTRYLERLTSRPAFVSARRKQKVLNP